MKLFFYAVSFLILAVIVLFPTESLYCQKLYINEVMASNVTTLKDPDYKAYSDWIEIYNQEEVQVNLRGYFITDDPGDKKKFKIKTDIIIQPKGFVLLWADDKDTLNHANFKLSSSGETLGLFDSAGTMIDTMSFGEQTSDISMGRFPDGGIDWVKFSPSTPGSTNALANIFAKLSMPSFSIQGGFYSGPLTLNLSHPDSGAVIRYTIDGKTPTVKSPVYTGPIKLDSTTAVSIRAFKDGYLPSNTSVNTYFINFQADLPVFSIVSDPDGFFSDTTGIYVIGTRGITSNCSTGPRNWNQDWERPANLELYEADKTPQFNLKAGVKIYGGCTRLYDMKSLAFYFRSEYGYDKLSYRLFPGYPIVEYNSFLLKSSGQDWYRTMFRDGMVHTVVKQGMNVDYLEYRPSIAFINGQYWGIHNIGEKISGHYLNSRFGVDPDSVDIIIPGTTGSALEGDITAYRALVNFYSSNSLAVKGNYEYIKSIVDIDEYIDYNIAEIYAANGDWPANNTKMWRPRTATGKWRMLLYDTDFGFGGNGKGQYNTNTLDMATTANGTGVSVPWATLMLRKLLENNDFKNEFIQRFAVHMYTTFDKDHVIQVIDSISAKIASEIPRHKARWAKSISMGNVWLDNVQIVRDFPAKRQAELRSHFYSKFGIPGAYSMKLSRNNPSWGKIIAHTVEIKNNEWTLILFKNIPFKAKAVALPGYHFVKWEGASGATNPEVELNPDANSTLTAVFEPDEASLDSTVVINEINYKSSSSFDTEDWIELYNGSAGTADLSGWEIKKKKSSDTFVLPESTYVEGHGYLVICRDSLKFNSLQTKKVKSIGNLPFGLDSEGDVVKLTDRQGNTIDSLMYGVSGEWPSAPQGSGSTLELLNPKMDNALPKNWKSSVLYGTPGRLNNTYTTGVTKKEGESVREFHLFENFPNPFNNSTIISFSIAERAHLTLKVYDILGREVARLVDEVKDPGNYNVPFTAELGSGIYIYVLQSGKNLQSKKMLLLR